MKLGSARFFRDQRGTTFEGVALSVAIIAVAFVASADMLDFLVKKHATPELAALTSTAPSTTASANLDYSPTASLPKLISRSVLDPCTGVLK